VVYEGTNPDTGQPIIKAFLKSAGELALGRSAVDDLRTLWSLTPGQKPAAQRGGQP